MSTAEPIWRDRKAEFDAFRRAARQQREWLRGRGAGANSDAGSDPSDGGDGGGAACSGAADALDAEKARMAAMCPPWMGVFDRCVDLEKTIRAKSERLRADQRDHLAPRFTAADTEADERAAIERRGKEISKLIKELDRMVETGIKPAAAGASDEALAAQNVQRHLAVRLGAVITDFKDTQTLFAEQIRRRDEKARKFQTLGAAPEVQERLQREEKSAGYMEMGYSQVEITELLAMEAVAKDQNKEAQDILASVMELHEMFQDLRNLVVEQGSVLDRIDYNVTQASIKITKGLGELKEARVEQKKCVVS